MTNENKFELTKEELDSLQSIANKLDGLAKERGWDDDMPEPGTKMDILHRATDIALFHSEVSEMLEGVRKNTYDDHIPEYLTEEAEAADIVIRVLHYVVKHNLRFTEALNAKHNYNLHREDHKRENRQKEGGKKF